METRLVSISHKQCRNGVLKRNDWVQLGLLKISKSSGEQSIFIHCSLRAAVETSWIVHVLFIPPLLLLAPGWIFDISPWAICSPVAGECEVEENRGFLGVRAPQGAEQMLSRDLGASARYQGGDAGWVWPSVSMWHLWHFLLLPDTKCSPWLPPSSSWLGTAGWTSIGTSPSAPHGCVGNL